MANFKKSLIIASYVILMFGILFSVLSFTVLKFKTNLLESDNSSLKSDNMELQSEVEGLKKEVEAIKNQLSSTEGTLKNVQALYKSAQATIEARESELADQKSLAAQYREEALTWKDKYMNSDPANVTYSYEFPSVNALISAIKKNPEAYHNKQVKVFGMLLTYNTYDSNKKYIKFVSLFDYKNENISFSPDDYAAEYLMRIKSETKEAIDVKLSSDLQYTVAETGDYVNLYGIVKITNGEIYLDKCQYN